MGKVSSYVKSAVKDGGAYQVPGSLYPKGWIAECDRVRRERIASTFPHIPARHCPLKGGYSTGVHTYCDKYMQADRERDAAISEAIKAEERAEADRLKSETIRLRTLVVVEPDKPRRVNHKAEADNLRAESARLKARITELEGELSLTLQMADLRLVSVG